MPDQFPPWKICNLSDFPPVFNSDHSFPLFTSSVFSDFVPFMQKAVSSHNIETDIKTDIKTEIKNSTTHLVQYPSPFLSRWPLPFPRTLHAVAVLGDHIYVFGGSVGTSDRHHLQGDLWSIQISEVFEPAKSVGGRVSNDSIATCSITELAQISSRVSRHKSLPIHPSEDRDEDGEGSNEINDELETADDETASDSDPSYLDSSYSAKLKYLGPLYLDWSPLLLNGLNYSDRPLSSSHLRTSPQRRPSWKSVQIDKDIEIGPWPTCRGGSSLVADQTSGCLYLFGGFCLNARAEPPKFTSCSTPDLTEPNRSVLPSSNSAQTTSYSAELWEYSTEEKRWELLGPPNHPLLSDDEVNSLEGLWPEGRAGHSCVIYNRRLIVYGGLSKTEEEDESILEESERTDDGSKHFGDVWSWDIKQRRWNILWDFSNHGPHDERHPSPRSLHTAIRCWDYSMLVSFGHDGESACSDFWAFDLRTSQWSKFDIEICPNAMTDHIGGRYWYV